MLSAEDILGFQQLIRKVPVTDNVIEYAVRLVGNTRPNNPNAPELVRNYLDWGWSMTLVNLSCKSECSN